jgi:hypothetical protein
MARTSYENFKYNVAVHALRITDSAGLRPNTHAQNKLVMYDFPARGGIETLIALTSPVSIC